MRSTRSRARVGKRRLELVDGYGLATVHRAWLRAQPIDEARSAIFYVDQLATDVLPALAEEAVLPADQEPVIIPPSGSEPEPEAS